MNTRRILMLLAAPLIGGALAGCVEMAIIGAGSAAVISANDRRTTGTQVEDEGIELRALGRKGDVLLAISTSGASKSVIAAARAARELGIAVVALTGRGGGALGTQLGAGDVHVCVPHDRTVRIQEVHLLALHCLCDGIDFKLFGAKP